VRRTFVGPNPKAGDGVPPSPIDLPPPPWGPEKPEGPSPLDKFTNVSPWILGSSPIPNLHEFRQYQDLSGQVDPSQMLTAPSVGFVPRYVSPAGRANWPDPTERWTDPPDRPPGWVEPDGPIWNLGPPKRVEVMPSGWSQPLPPPTQPGDPFGALKGISLAPARNLSPSDRAFTASAAPVSFLSPGSQRAARGLPALLAEVDSFDPANPKWPSGGGLPGLIREYLRNK
jgi:hypothetical protein